MEMKSMTESASLAMKLGGESGSKIVKDTMGAELITRTIEHMNTSQTLSGPKVNADYQFQKDVLGSMGIGNKLDISA